MAKYPETSTEVEQFCRSAGFEFAKLESVRDRVYKGILRDCQLENSSTVFIKFHPTSKQREFQEFVKIATDVGHPECHLINEEYLCLIMGTAPGRPLSQLLPIAFVPGIWKIQKERFQRAYFQLGQQLSKLHSNTRDGSGPLLSKSKQKEAIKRANKLPNDFSNQLISKIQNLVSEQYTTPYAITYDDRSPHNIYFDGSTLTQIDFAGKKRSIASEHATVLVGVQLMQRRLPYVLSNPSDSIEKHYWRGYNQTDVEKPTTKAVAIWCIYLYLHLLNFYDKDPTSLNAKITKTVDRSAIYKNLKHIVKRVY